MRRSSLPAARSEAIPIRIRRASADGAYNAEFFAGPASEFANAVRNFPAEWILPDYQGVTEEALDYFRPLIEGEPKLVFEDGRPATLVPFNKR